MTALPCSAQAADLYRAYAAAVRPFEYCLPSEWAERYRVMTPSLSPEAPGKWSNRYFPVLGPLMDAIAAAVDAGKIGVVIMKSAQGGGSAAVENVVGWFLDNYPGPGLYIHATQDMARQWGRDHFGSMIDGIPHWRAQEIPGRRAMLKLRCVKFSLTLAGGQSKFNYQSNPYRIVVIDEVDSVKDAFRDEGDPVKIAVQRTTSFRGKTIIIAFAHPTTSERGAGELYYRDSDQQRAFVVCPHCKIERQLCWTEGTDRQAGEQVARVKSVPHERQTREDALADPTTYGLWCPCGCEITDSQRWQTLAAGVVYRNTLAPEMAARMPWAGLHFSQLYYPNKTILKLAHEWVACLNNEDAKKVFIQKSLGECYEATVSKTSALDWRRLVSVPRFAGDPDCYERGEIPNEVQYLTAGVDSRGSEFHWIIWGWGLRRTASKATALCGWLIDWGNPKRSNIPKDDDDRFIFTEGDYWIFDMILFERQFQRRDGQYMRIDLVCTDEGWAATQLAVHHYCRKHEMRARACKGMPATDKTRMPIFQPGKPYVYTYQGQTFKDESWLKFNTYALKEMLFKAYVKGEFDVLGKTEKARKLTLPIFRREPDEDELVAHLSSESVKRQKNGSLAYVKHTENHWLDCTVYALGAMESLNAFAPMLPFDEQLSAINEAVKAADNDHAYIPGGR